MSSPDPQPQPHIAILGAGITGLSAAWEIQRQAPGLAVTLIEAGLQPGGKIISEAVDLPGLGRFIIDGGPESFITRKPEAWALAHELGLGDQIAPSSSEAKHIYILERGKAHRVPLDPISFLTSPLLSPGGKLRLALEPFVAPRRDDGDESLAAFSARRLGREAAERLIGPILGGIYNTDPATQSILTTSAVMREMEREHGGLFRGSLARLRSRRAAARAGEPAGPAFFTLKEGAASLVTALTRQLKATLRLATRAQAVEPVESGYCVRLAGGDPLRVDGVLIATPAPTAALILRGHYRAAAEALAAIPHSSLGTVSLAYRRAELPDSDLRGLMIPRREGRAIDALTWTSRKMPARAPEQASLLRVFIGGSRPDLVESDETALVDTVRAELAALLGIRAEPLFARAYRWPGSYPQALVGHLDRVDEIERLLPTGVRIAGASYRGLGVPDCVRQGRAAARALLNDLGMSEAARAG